MVYIILAAGWGYAAGIAVLLLNALGVLLVVLQLPGTWLMLVATALLAWWYYEPQPLISVWTLGALLALAVIGELFETAAAAHGSRKAGGTKTGAIISIFGAIVGAIVGTVVILIPVVGTVLGACVGAGLGAIVGDLMRGRRLVDAGAAGRGAAVGRFWGTIGKTVVAVIMWVVTAVAVFWS